MIFLIVNHYDMMSQLLSEFASQNHQSLIELVLIFDNYVLSVSISLCSGS